MSNDSLKIVSYNIKGLEGKHLNDDFNQYLQSFDVFILLETHADSGKQTNEQFKEKHSDFDLYCKDAIKELRKGRGSGGSIIGIRKSLKDIGVKYSMEELDVGQILKLRLSSREVNILPLYIRPSTWEKEFEKFQEEIDKLDVVDNFLILGDVNIRLGEVTQDVVWFPCIANKNGRKSEDKKHNKKGISFCDFCNKKNFQILNGLTHGDCNGRFTFIDPNLGKSTNDIAAVSRNILAIVKDFKVDSPETGDTRHGSDHVPIYVQLHLHADQYSETVEDLPVNECSFDSSLVQTESSMDADLTDDEVRYACRRICRRDDEDFIAEKKVRCNELYKVCNTHNTENTLRMSKEGDAEILLEIIEKRLNNWCNKNKIFNDFQHSSANGLSKLDLIYNLHAAVHIELAEKRGRVYAYFLNIQNSFPSRTIEFLFEKLQKLGVSSKVICFLRFAICNSNVEDLDSHLHFKKLIRLMNSLYLNDLPESINGGLVIENRRVGLLMCTNHIVLLSESVSKLKNMINQLQVYCHKWHLTIDHMNSEVMVFSRGGMISASESCSIYGKKIKTVFNVTFLGFFFTSKLSSTRHVLEMIKKAETNFQNFEALDDWRKFMKMYMVNVWGCQEFKQIDRLQALVSRKGNKTVANSLAQKSLNSLAQDLFLEYIGKVVFVYEKDSLSRFLTLKVIEKNVFWAETLDKRCNTSKIDWKYHLQSQKNWDKLRSILNQS